MRDFATLLVLVVVTTAGPVDQHATRETNHLWTLLKNMAANQNQIMFGQNMANYFGVFGGHQPYKLYAHDGVQGWLYTSWNAEQHHALDLCDVKQLTGQYPALTGYGFESLESQGELLAVTVTANDAIKHGMLVCMSWHPNNFITGSNSWIENDHGNVVHSVKRILPGGDLNWKLHQYLDRIADWAHNFKDSQGRLAPFVFRPWHELNGGWFWWGLNNKAQNSAHDLQELYRHTVQYLRDVKGVHNILYAFSPDKFKNQGEYLSIYPGDDYVDILGMDYYFSKEGCCTNDFKRMVDDVVHMAEARGKIAAVTELGLFQNGLDSHHDFWSNYVLGQLKSSATTRRIAYLYTWTNQCYDNGRCDYYVPYKGHPAESDFLKFFHDPETVFRDRAPNFYS